MFASGKTFTLSELIQAVDDIIANPAAKNDPALKDKLDWLFAHFAPGPDQKQLLLSYPQYLRAALQQTLDVRNKLSLTDIKLSAPHEAYLRLHAARLGLNDTQTDWLISQQKQAAAAKAIDDLAAQGVTTPDSTQIQNQIQARINWTNRHTASLQTAVASADAHISRQLQQALRPVIAQNPTIPRAQVAQAAYELAQTSYQALKPQIPTIGSDKNLAAVLKQEILTPERLNQVATLQAFGFTPDQFSAAIDAASRTLFRRHLKAARTNLRLLQMYGKETQHLVTTTMPPPEIRPKGAPGFHDLRTAYGYPGETLINAADPDAAENTIINLPKALVKAVTYPIRAWVIGNIETSFVSLSLTRSQTTVQAFALHRVYPLLPNQLKQTQDFNQIQVWIKSQVQALREGQLTLDFDSREKLLEANNNLVLLEFGQKYRALVEKIPGMKFLLQRLNFFGDRISPLFVGYTKAFLGLAFRSDPLTAANIIFDYGLVRPTAQILFRSVVIPLTRFLPFGWDLKPTAFGQEVYWKPAKWVKDKVKEGLFKLAEKTGLKRAGEWIAQKIFKTTLAKLAATVSGIFLGISLGWGFFKKALKAGLGIMLLFIATYGQAAFWGALAGSLTLGTIGGILGAKILGAAGLVLCGPVCGAIGASFGFAIGFGIGFIIGAITGGILGILFKSALSWLASLPAWLSQALSFASSFSIGLTFSIPTWVAIVIPSGIVGYQIFQKIQLQTALMAPAIGPIDIVVEDLGEIQRLKTGDIPGNCLPTSDVFLPGSTYSFNQPFYESGHPGIDITVYTNGSNQAPLISPFSCPTLVYVGTPANSPAFANYVVFVSGNVAVIYAHLEAANVSDGDIVDPQAIVGIQGNEGNSSGPHLHLEVRIYDHPPTRSEVLRDLAPGTYADPCDLGFCYER